MCGIGTNPHRVIIELRVDPKSECRKDRRKKEVPRKWIFEDLEEKITMIQSKTKE